MISDLYLYTHEDEIPAGGASEENNVWVQSNEQESLKWEEVMVGWGSLTPFLYFYRELSLTWGKQQVLIVFSDT